MEKGSLFQKHGQTIEAGWVLFQDVSPEDTLNIIKKGRIKITKLINNAEN